MRHRWMMVGVVAVMAAAGACSGSAGPSGSPTGPTTSATVMAAVEATTTTTAPAVTPLGPPAIDVGDPADFRAPVPGALASPAPTVQELCTGSYVKKNTPTLSTTDPVKAAQVAHGPYADKDPSHYVEDELIPVELGGAPTDPRNLWPQTTDMVALKNREENHLRTVVCHGDITPAAAQNELLQNWGPFPNH